MAAAVMMTVVMITALITAHETKSAVDDDGGGGGPAAHGVRREVTTACLPRESAEEAGALREEDVGAWRALWGGALDDAPRRAPALDALDHTVEAQLGAVAHLHCRARHAAAARVSWVRRRDWHIISSGRFMYTSDERFQVLHGEDSDDWILQVKYVQRRDNGTYECQVSHSGGAASRLVHLMVSVPEVFILGADDHHVDAGSALNLVCIVEKSPVPPQYVFWYHNARMINYDAAAGVSVDTAAGTKTRSALTVRRAAPYHSGNYTCRAANADPATIRVYVSEGSDKMAATLSRDRDSRAARCGGGGGALLAAALLTARLMRPLGPDGR